MPNYAKNRQTLRKANDMYHDSNHQAFRETKTKSFYPFGRRKGAGLSRSEQYCNNYDAIFGKKEVEKEDESSETPLHDPDECATCRHQAGL